MGRSGVEDGGRDPEEKARASSRVRLKLLGGAAIVAALVLCYLPSLDGEFLWDDDRNVSDNAMLRDIAGLSHTWTNTAANQQYYPLTLTSFWLEYRLWGLRPAGYRLTNLVLHALVAMLIWAGLERLRVPGAWMAAAVFALHPVNVETVAWITERKNLLSAVFYWSAALAYIRFAGLDRGGEAPATRRKALYGAAILLFCAAMLSKTAVVTFPAAVLLAVWWKRGRVGRKDLWAVAPFFVIGLVMGGMTWWIERHHVGAVGANFDRGLVERILVAGRALWFYAVKTLLPLGLNFIYPRWAIRANDALTYLFPLTAMAVPAVFWALRDRIGRGPLTGVAYFGLTVMPALGFLDFYFQRYSFVQDHLQYLASAGLIALVVGSAETLLGDSRRSVGIAACVLVLGSLGTLTWQRSHVFRNQELLWTDVLARNPGAWMAHINLAGFYGRQGQLDEAIEHYEQALAIPDSDQHVVHYNLGFVFGAQGRTEDAVAHYEKAIAMEPGRSDRAVFLAQAHNNLADLLASAGRTNDAIEHFRAAIEAERRSYIAHTNLAGLLRENGLESEAEEHYREALRIKPDYWPAHSGLGMLLASEGRYQEAVASYRAALAIDSTHAAVFHNLGLSLEALRNLDGAESAYREAIKLDPELAGPHNNLAIVLYNKERYDEAWQEVERFRRLGGTPHPGFLRALSVASPR